MKLLVPVTTVYFNKSAERNGTIGYAGWCPEPLVHQNKTNRDAISAWMKFTVALQWMMFTFRQLHEARFMTWRFNSQRNLSDCMYSSFCSADNETYLLFLLSACFLGWNQRFVVGAAFCCEVDLGQSVLYQCHRQIHAFNVQPANEVACFVHALHFNFNLWNKKKKKKIRQTFSFIVTYWE